MVTDHHSTQALME